MLTARKIKKLRRIIKDFSDRYAIAIFGTDAVDEAELLSLRRRGLVPKTTAPKLFEHSYVLGKLQSVLDAHDYSTLSFTDLQNLAKTEIKLTQDEKEQIAAAKVIAGNRLQKVQEAINDGLFVEIERDFRNTLKEQHVKKIVKEEVIHAVISKKTSVDLTTRLEEVLGEASRDWARVAITELHAIEQLGIVRSILKKEGHYGAFDDDNPRVIVQVFPDACKECKAAYLDDDGSPKVFLLDDLISNGTNVGVKKSERKAVIPPHHPRCNCRIVYLPPGIRIDAEGYPVLESRE